MKNWDVYVLLEADRKLAAVAMQKDIKQAWDEWAWGAFVVFFLHRCWFVLVYYGRMVDMMDLFLCVQYEILSADTVRCKISRC
jgi:hypothetical protein